MIAWGAAILLVLVTYGGAWLLLVAVFRKPNRPFQLPSHEQWRERR
jgi:hypothetical protein